MNLPRRTFLKSSILFGASTALVMSTGRLGLGQTQDSKVPPPGFIPLEAQQDPVFRFSRGTFEPYVGDLFYAPDARGRMVSLKLVKVESYKPKLETKLSTKTAPGTETFLLLFSASAPLPPFTSIHKVNHPALGEFSLFLTTRKGKDDEILYEAVFSHVR